MAPSFASPLRAIRRLVTGNKPDGNSTFLIDDALSSASWGGSTDKGFTRLWVTDQTPADTNTFSGDMAKITPDRMISQTNGTHCICMEIGPGARSPEHRTNSIDYVILISGQLTLILDNGEERTLTEPGSVVVQRGTMHTWANKTTDTWARYVIVVVDAKPSYRIDASGAKHALAEGVKR